MTLPVDAEPLFQLPESPRIRLIDAYLYGVQFSRRDRLETDPDGPTLGVAVRGRLEDTKTANRHHILLSANLVYPFNDKAAVAELEVITAGVFQVLDDSVDLDELAQGDAVVIVYPYLRSFVGQVWRMSGLTVAPLPTLDTLATLQAMVAATQPTDEGSTREPGTAKRSRRRKKAAATTD